jgi:diguanylate cyclase (GGDEF)-like protein
LEKGEVSKPGSFPARNQTNPKTSQIGFLEEIAPRKRWQAFGLLIAGLVTTLLAGLFIKADVERAALNEYSFLGNEIILNITDRIDSSAMALYSGAALFYASSDVSRSEWRVFTSQMRLEQQLPGTQGIGFARLISPNQLEAHIQAVRAEGFPNYTLQPGGKRDIYTAIVYLEPFAGRNLRAFGYDMFSEPIRREAMVRARDENSAALSGRVTLMQETDEDVQSGVVMYVPVYRNGAPITTPAERRAALIGWVYSPFRMDDLMRGTLGSHSLQRQEHDIILQIYDGRQAAPDALLYDSRVGAERNSGFTARDVSRVIQENYYGRTWTIRLTHLGRLTGLQDYGSLWMVLIGGTSISLLVFGLTISLLRTAHYLESIRLLAEMDGLTGVNNRSKILSLAHVEFLRARRMRHAFTILMIDLNFFKHINDSYGHSTGDQALRLTAGALLRSLRKDIDWIGRFGGDEFIILLTETNLAQAEPIIQRLRESVTAATGAIVPGFPPVSLSIGAAGLHEGTQSLEELIELADRAMYADKRLAKE